MLYWSIFMIVICYAHLISIARISKNQCRQCRSLTDNSMDHLLYLPKQYVMPCQSQQQITMRHILSHTQLKLTGEQRLLRIFTIAAKCRSKGMTTPSVVRTVWKQRYTPLRKNKVWASFYTPRRLPHAKTNEQTIRVQCGTNWKE
jgi:hypothetical protein